MTRYEEISEEVLDYWIQSWLDLFGMWGGIIAVLDIIFGSFGVPFLRRWSDSCKAKKEERQRVYVGGVDSVGRLQEEEETTGDGVQKPSTA